MDYSLPGSSVRGIFQARILAWVTISHSSGSFWPRDQTHDSCISCIGWWIVFFFYHWATWEAWYIKCGLISQSLCWVKKSRAIRLYTLNVFQLTWNPEDCATCRGSQTGSCWWTPWPPFQPWELTFSVQSSEKPSVYFFKSRSLEQVAPRGTPFEKLYWPF